MVHLEGTDTDDFMQYNDLCRVPAQTQCHLKHINCFMWSQDVKLAIKCIQALQLESSRMSEIDSNEEIKLTNKMKQLQVQIQVQQHACAKCDFVEFV